MSKMIQKYLHLKEAAAKARGAADFEGLSSDILTRVVIDSITKYRQKVVVGAQDSVSDLLDSFKFSLAEAVFEVAAGWKVVNREPFLFPRGCRFCHTRGNTTIFVIEQEPQIRTLSFEGRMIGETPFTGENFEPEPPPERLPMALPYVVFLITSPTAGSPTCSPAGARGRSTPRRTPSTSPSCPTSSTTCASAPAVSIATPTPPCPNRPNTPSPTTGAAASTTTCPPRGGPRA